MATQAPDRPQPDLVGRLRACPPGCLCAGEHHVAAELRPPPARTGRPIWRRVVPALAAPLADGFAVHWPQPTT